MSERNHITRRLLSTAVLCLLVTQIGAIAIGYAESPSIETRSKVTDDALRRGEERRRRWDLEAAGDAFREAARLEPANLDAKLGLARIARVRLQYSQSLKLLENAATDHPNSASLFCEYGSLYLAVEEPQRARGYFERARAISETSASI